MNNPMSMPPDQWISFSVAPISRIAVELSFLLFDKFGFAQSSCEKIIARYFTAFRDDISVLIELPYVDKVFRNSYYHYFSSKHCRFERDSIRLSFFEGELSEQYLSDSARYSCLAASFLGVVIIRPTFPQLFGRTTLSPKVFKLHDFVACLSTNSCSINGFKLDVAAFPHASQDGEHLTCAETSIWSIMEYFGNRYPEYLPVLPSDIITALSNPSFERVVPSRGLTVSQISFVLKEFGFGPRIYSREAFCGKESDFRRILSWYVESGIPVIVALEKDTTGHAVLFIGHENVSGAFRTWSTSRTGDTNSGIVDTSDFDKRYIVIDDNYPPYQICTFDNPTGYYTGDPAFMDMRIAAFVVPLHPRIYLEPLEAFSLALEVILNIMTVSCDDNQVITRFYLTSSRSYKNWVVHSTLLQKELKDVILTTSMPKFIWITEISDARLYGNSMAAGMIIIDATGDVSRNSLLFSAYSGTIYLRFDGVDTEVTTGFANFTCYENNLKGEWSQWKA